MWLEARTLPLIVLLAQLLSPLVVACDNVPLTQTGLGVTVGDTATMRSASTLQVLNVNVELDIFSGRPNPSWTLSPADAKYASEALAAAPPLSSSRVLSLGLGYRGFLLTFGRDGASQTARVVDGVIEVHRAGRTTQLADPDRALERRLVQSSATHVNADLLQSIKGQLP